MAVVTWEMVRDAFVVTDSQTDPYVAREKLSKELAPLFNIGGGGGGAVDQVAASLPITVAPTSGVGVVTVGHAVSGVLAGSYGDDTHFPVVTVDATGHVSAVSVRALPLAGSAAPLALGVASPGSSTAYAREDHVHPMPTAVQVGAEPGLGNPSSSGQVLSSSTGGVRTWIERFPLSATGLNQVVVGDGAGGITSYGGLTIYHSGSNVQDLRIGGTTVGYISTYSTGTYVGGFQMYLDGALQYRLISDIGGFHLEAANIDAPLNIAPGASGAVTIAESGSRPVVVGGIGSGFVRSSGGTLSASALIASEIPNLDASKITTGAFADARIASAATWNAKLGTVTADSTSRAANTFYAAPNGAAGAATFRAIVAADVPTLNQNTTGSAAKWTTPRTLTIGATGKTIDGSANVSWSLADIGAAAASSLASYLPLSGGTMNTGAQILTAKDITPSTSSNTNYAGAPLVAQRASNTGTTTAAAVGFHNVGVNAAALYYDAATSVFRYNRHTGDIVTIWDASNLTNLNQLVNGPGYVTNSTVANVDVTEHSANNTNYPVVWDNGARSLYHTAAKMWFNPYSGLFAATAIASGSTLSWGGGILRDYTASTNTTALYGARVGDPNNANYSLVIAKDGSEIYMRGSNNANLVVGSRTIAQATSLGLTVTGRFSASSELAWGGAASILSSDYVVHGTGAGPYGHRTAEVSSFNTLLPSGFYDNRNGISPLTTSWTHMIRSSHSDPSSGSATWSFDIAANFYTPISGHQEGYYVRVNEGSNWGTWRTLWHSGNLSASTLPGGPYLPTAAGSVHSPGAYSNAGPTLVIGDAQYGLSAYGGRLYLWTAPGGSVVSPRSFTCLSEISAAGSITAGIAQMSAWSANPTVHARFGHQSWNTGAGFGYLQASDGEVYLEAPTGRYIHLRINGPDVAMVSSTGVTLSKALYLNDNVGAYIIGGRNTTGDPYFYVTSTGTPTAGIRLLTNNAGTGIVALSAAANGAITLASSLAWGGGATIPSSDYVVQGNGVGVLGHRTTNLGTATTIPATQSGFYDMLYAADAPQGAVWTHMIRSAHSGNATNNQWMFDIAAPFGPGTGGVEGYYVRTTSAGSTPGWRQLWHSGNLSSLTLPGGPYLPKAGTTGDIGIPISNAYVASASNLAFFGRTNYWTGNPVTSVGLTLDGSTAWLRSPTVRIMGSSYVVADFTDSAIQLGANTSISGFMASTSVSTGDALVGGMKQVTSRFWTTSSILPLMAPNTWCFLVCDFTGGANVMWTTNSSQTVSIRSGGSTYTTAVNSTLTDGGPNFFANYRTMILIGPTVSSNSQCSVIVW